jgi:outer membrane beta-barrel protein
MIKTAVFPLVLLLSFGALAQDADKGPEGAAAPASEAEGDSEVDLAPDRDPRSGTPLIYNKLYPMQFRFEGTGFFDYSLANKYIEHLGGHGGLTFHIFDWLAVEGFGGYLVADETNIAKRVRQQRASKDPDQCAQPTCEPELPDLWQTTWFAGGDVQWSPLYGKLSLVSELDFNFQLYGLLGGGVEGITKKLNDGSFTSPEVRPSVNYGIGLRLIPWKWIALRLELRNYNGANPAVEEIDDNCAEGYTLQVGTEQQCFTDFSSTTLVQFGISFLI